MNGYELWRLREYGLCGVEVQRRQSEFWAKRNHPVERRLYEEKSKPSFSKSLNNSSKRIRLMSPPDTYSDDNNTASNEVSGRRNWFELLTEPALWQR